MVGVVLAVGGVTGLPDEPLGELDELAMVGVLSTLTPLSLIVMMGKRYTISGREGLRAGGRGGAATAGCGWSWCAVAGGLLARQASAGEEGSSGFREGLGVEEGQEGEGVFRGRDRHATRRAESRELAMTVAFLRNEVFPARPNNCCSKGR